MIKPDLVFGLDLTEVTCRKVIFLHTYIKLAKLAIILLMPTNITYKTLAQSNLWLLRYGHLSFKLKVDGRTDQ